MKGATVLLSLLQIRMAYFNPRTHEGCDQRYFAGRQEKANISIHAPMKGATRILYRAIAVSLDFNPRTHEGCDTRSVAWV